jgi:tetratricopeptide (TPR) repeat protein
MVLILTKRDKWQWAAVLIAACILTYANGLGGGFTYDDKAIVRDNPRIRSPGNVSQIFATSYFGGPRGAGTVYRPVLLLSYAVQWWIHGRQAVAFHAVNVLLHAGATLLLAALLLRIAIPPAAAFAGALLFAVVPIHVEAVTSLVGRGEVLAAVFTLLYLHLALRHFRYLSPPGLAASDALAAPCHPEVADAPEPLWRRRERSDEGSASAPSNRSRSFASLRMTRRFPLPLSRLAVLLAALLCYALAVLTKESGSSAPALALLLFVFVEEGGLRERLGRAFVRGLPVLCGSVAAIVGVFFLRRWVLGGFIKSPGTGIFEVENALFPLDPLSRAINACVILFRYLGRTVFPLHLSADESAWSIEVVSGKSPLAIGAVLLLAGITAAALRRLSSRSPLALGFLFFCLALLPASNLLFPIGTIFAERLAYLPSAGLCLAAGSLIVGSASRLDPGGGPYGPPNPRSALTPRRSRLLAAAVLLLSARTIVRNSVWWSDEGLFLNLVRTAPESAKAHYDIAYIWADERQYSRAREQFEQATEIYEDYWDAWAGKGRVEKEMGLLSDAEDSYESAIEANPRYENGYFGLGLVREARGDPAGAEEIYRKGLAQKKESLPLAYRLAVVRSRLEWPAALEDWRRALALGPSTPSVHADFASWLLRVGKTEDAAREARQALAFEPRYLPALRLLAERDALSGRTFAEALAREKIFRLSRSPEDWALLLRASEKSEAYARRFAHQRGSLAKLRQKETRNPKSEIRNKSE